MPDDTPPALHGWIDDDEISDLANTEWAAVIDTALPACAQAKDDVTRDTLGHEAVAK